jgi:osmotically-inducible protein OsmY
MQIILRADRSTKQYERKLKMGSHLRKVFGFTSILITMGAVAGCATYQNCRFGGCPGDADITANVHALLDKHPDLGPPNSIDVQTDNHVVFLYGMVSEGLQSREAEAVALAAPGVTQVENSIAVSR